jgi:hypothetical protein
MTHCFKLSRRMARVRVPLIAGLLFAFGACNNTDSFNPDSSSPAESQPTGAALPDSAAVPVEAPSLSTSFSGGIPFGTFQVPITSLGSVYNGGKRTVGPYTIKTELAAAKARGGRIVLMLAGSESNYKDGNGHFSLSKWKQRIDRFRGINFSSYISDGTIIGHYMIDEPQDPTNWNGQPIAPSTVDQMGQYSKQLWPGMATIVRTEPRYFNSNPRYVDAAWAQYVSWYGDPAAYVRKNVADAQNRGLALVVGLNFIKGGDPKHTAMTASEVQAGGSGLLSSSYPCAFISWQYNSSYLSTSSMKSAMDVLRGKAQNRSARSCHASAGSTTPPPPPPPPPPAPAPTPTASPFAFGLYQTPLEAYSTRWTGALYKADPASLVTRLHRADSTRMKLIVMLTSAAGSKNADGTFSFTKWKAQVDRYRSLPLGPYVTSKALYLHNLVELPNCATCWGGKAIPWATLEQMAQYSKSIWPGLATTARVAPSKLAAATFRWTYLDAGWAEYNTTLGDLRSYLTAESGQARLEGLGLVTGLNLVDASGYNTPSMTASQIKEFGTILAGNASVCALVGRRYDAVYLGQTGIGQALDSVGRVAKRRTSASCVVN